MLAVHGHEGPERRGRLDDVDDVDRIDRQDLPRWESPLQRLTAELGADRTITEIMVNGPGPVWVERAGRIEHSGLEIDGSDLELLVEAVVAPLGLRVDRSSPIVDARLPDGSRVNIVVPPLAIDGAAVSIRRFARSVLPLTAFGPPDLGAVLTDLVDRKASILVVGPTSSGKTSLLATLARLTDPAERIICIEDTAELPLQRRNLVRLEAREPNSEGVGAVPLRRLVLTALRMRPDRLIVGEVRGAEAFDLLLALTSGHRGCLTSCHAPNAEAGLRRLETLAALAGSGLASEQLRRLVFDGLDAVVVTGRSVGGAGGGGSGGRTVRSVVAIEGDGHGGDGGDGGDGYGGRPGDGRSDPDGHVVLRTRWSAPRSSPDGRVP